MAIIIKHNKTIEQLKKMNTETMHKLYIKVTGRELFNPYEEREMMTAVLASYGPEQNDVSNDEYRESYWTQRDLNIRGQIAEAAAQVPGWKRNWIRNLRYNGKGASWSMIMELTGLSENMVFNIAKGKIYRWDFDSEAKIIATQGHSKITRETLGLGKHVQNELDMFFAE